MEWLKHTLAAAAGGVLAYMVIRAMAKEPRELPE